MAILFSYLLKNLWMININKQKKKKKEKKRKFL